jgi:Membrane dipeptidase (Peptidase family M19)
MLIFDAHLDLALNGVDWNRDLRQSVTDVRAGNAARRWVRGSTKPEVTLDRVVDNIDNICQLAGNCRHAGIGSDLDGGYGSEQTPADLDTIADLHKLPELLQKRGYSDDDVRAVMHGNWIRFFSEVLPAGRDGKTASLATSDQRRQALATTDTDGRHRQ